VAEVKLSDRSVVCHDLSNLFVAGRALSQRPACAEQSAVALRAPVVGRPAPSCLAQPDTSRIPRPRARLAARLVPRLGPRLGARLEAGTQPGTLPGLSAHVIAAVTSPSHRPDATGVALLTGGGTIREVAQHADS
jgi:hypothetical protein